MKGVFDMTQQFPHYRVAKRQKEDHEECTWQSILSMPYVILGIGLVLGVLLSKCCPHHK